MASSEPPDDDAVPVPAPVPAGAPALVSVDEVVEVVGDAPDARAIARIEVEERQASQRLATIEAGRRKGGLAGAAMAGVMLGLRDIYDGPPKDDTIVAIVESPDEPGDIDTEGIEVTVGDVEVWAPPPTRRDEPGDDQSIV
jgi:hypothetical protein